MRKALPLVCAVLGLAAISGVAGAEEVDNPAYVAWAKVKPGTTVTYKSTTDMKMGAQSMKTETTIVQTLKEVKPEGAVIETSGKMTMNGQERAIPANTTTVPPKVEKGKEGLPPDMKGEVTDLKTGKETVEVNGKKYDAETREYNLKMTQPMEMTSANKVWTSADVPGTLVKSEAKTSAPFESATTMTLVSVETK